MHALDYAVIIAYFVSIMLVGLIVSKKAAGSIEDYFLGGRHIPWFILGVSGVATYLDMSGTMLQTSFFYTMGVKGYWVAYRGAIALTLAFSMVFMGKWQRRACVMTNAELMERRFGSGKQGQLASLLSAISILVIILAFIPYFFVGAGKFLHLYLPDIPEHWCAIGLFAIVLVYTMASGFYGVVYTDILQAVLILGVMVWVMFKAMNLGTAEYFARYTDPQWLQFTPQWTLDGPNEGMHLFGLLLLTWIVINVFQGFALPFDAWSSQRFYAARDERESALIPMQWIVLMSFRFLLMMGIGVLGLQIANQIQDPEMALPAVINHYFPVGLKGVFIAALIAAAMSTLDSCLNSSAAYFVRDIYSQYIKPSAGRKHLVRVSYATTVAIMVIGTVIGLQIPNIDRIWGWIIVGLFTGLLPPNIMKWFWWRFNGMGYAFGMGAGIAAATVQVLFFNSAPEYVLFPYMMLAATAGSIVGVYLGKPTEKDVLVRFYKQIRPFGFWGPVREQCDPQFVAEVKKETRRDLLLLIPGCLFQVTLFWLATALVVKKWYSVSIAGGVLCICGWLMYTYWYRNLKTGSVEVQA